jgi:uncharacterized protein (TIGR03663 family)
VNGAAAGRPGRFAAARDVLLPCVPLILAAALRFPRLGLRPLHHDEGSNVIFLLRLLREGAYDYDPSNYHGPLLYLLSAVPLFLFGISTEMLRLVPALLGTLTAVLPWCLRRELGRSGAVAAGVLLATSPSMVWYSRDNIHEIYLVFLTLLLFVGLVRGLSSSGWGWLAAAGAALGGMLATKETAVLGLGAILAAVLLSRGGGLGAPRRGPLVGGVLIAAAIAVALYTDLFSDPGGLRRPFEALWIWGGRGFSGDGHRKPWWYFLSILAREERVILVAAIAGAALALRRRDRFAGLLAAWGGTILAAYSCIPYKTPWLVLNIVAPLALLAGRSFGPPAGAGQEAGDSTGGGGWRVAAALLLGAGALLSARRAVDIAFVHYDDDRASPLIYVQTRRSALRLVERVEEEAARSALGRSMPIQVLSPDYLPLNWYLRDFTDVAYYGSVIERPTGPVVIARSDACDRVAETLGPGYTRETFALRPGVDLCLFLALVPERPPG